MQQYSTGGPTWHTLPLQMAAQCQSHHRIYMCVFIYNIYIHIYLLDHREYIRDESGRRPKKAEIVEIIRPTANFHENADFHPIGLALSGNPEVRFQLSLLL